MEAFIGPRPLFSDILHLDHDPSNNALTNLAYGTRRENLLMDYKVGKRTTPDAWKYSQNGKRTKPFQEYV